MTVSETPTKADYLLDEQIGYLLRLAHQRHAAIFQTHTVAGLTATQFSVLVRLAEHGPCSQNHLGRLAAMDVATIKGVVDRLRHKGYVQMNPSVEDKRRNMISLTDQGSTLMDKLYEAGREITEKTLEPLSASEQQTLLKLLGKIS